MAVKKIRKGRPYLQYLSEEDHLKLAQIAEANKMPKQEVLRWFISVYFKG